MIYGLYQSAAGMMTNEYRQDVLANNLANAETIGFKPEVASFAERLRASEAGRRVGPTNELLEALSGGVWLSQTQTDFSEGAFVDTGKPLDVALAGPGFLTVQTDGETLLTRDGRLLMDRDGWLVSALDGAPVLGPAGAPIRLNPRLGEHSISIDETGRIYQDGNTVGQLGLADVDNYRALQKVGDTRFSPGGTGTVPSTARVIERHLERSGTEPIRMMVSMLEATRAYQLNGQMVTLQDQTAARLINAVAA